MQIKNHISVIISILVSWGWLNCVTLTAQNAPVSTIGTVNSYGNTATVPVSAINVSNIGSFSIKILYDQAIVHPVAVTTDPLLGGTLSVNLNNPGVIFLSWFTYPALTLGGNPVIFNIDFTKLSPGISALTWFDDGYSCAWYDGNSVALNDVPSATYYISGSVSFNSPDAPHTIIPTVYTCQGTNVSVPVLVTGFNNIGKISLTLHYDITSLTFQYFTNTSGFPGLAVNGIQPGTVIISGLIPSGGAGYSLADSSSLLTLNFNYLGGAANLIWYDDGVSCQHSGAPPTFYVLNDTPQNVFYINGTVGQTPSPANAGVITGPSGGDVCAGQTDVNLSVLPIPHADVYNWTLPPGAVVTGGAMTNNITVTFGNTTGNWDITVYGSNSCGNGLVSPAFPVFVNTPPSITTQPVSPGTVNAGEGMASFTVEAAGSFLTYQWQEFSDSWNNLANEGVYSGALSSVLTITNPPLTMDGNRYRCMVSGFCPPVVISNGDAMLSVSNLTGIESTSHGENGSDNSFSLDISPNPATISTTLTYFLPDDGRVLLELFNIYGKKVDVIFNGNETRGPHKKRIPVQINTGLYTISLSFQTGTKGYTASEKLIFK
jgi:hypothetical protein